MAREHPAGDHQVHPRGLLTYAPAEIAGGPWPGRLALGPLPRSDEDVADIRDWGAGIIVSLVQDHEAEGAGVAGLEGRFAAAGIACIRAPIRDFNAPDDAFETGWANHGPRVLDVLNGGGRVLVHCWGGKGRSGTITAALLVAGGIAPDAAIALVRSARPGAIETPEQEAWILGWPSAHPFAGLDPC